MGTSRYSLIIKFKKMKTKTGTSKPSGKILGPGAQKPNKGAGKPGKGNVKKGM